MAWRRLWHALEASAEPMTGRPGRVLLLLHTLKTPDVGNPHKGLLSPVSMPACTRRHQNTLSNSQPLPGSAAHSPLPSPHITSARVSGTPDPGWLPKVLLEPTSP